MFTLKTVLNAFENELKNACFYRERADIALNEHGECDLYFSDLESAKDYVKRANVYIELIEQLIMNYEIKIQGKHTARKISEMTFDLNYDYNKIDEKSIHNLSWYQFKALILNMVRPID